MSRYHYDTRPLKAAWTIPALVAWAFLALIVGGGVLADENARDLDQDLESEPGFFDFESQKLFSREDLDIHLSVKGPLLQLVAATTREDEPELAAILDKLKGIEVRAYTVSETRRRGARELLENLAERLTRDRWQPAVTIQVKRQQGYVFLRYRRGDADPVGLAAMYLTEENQAVFVNIVGSIQPVAIGRLARRFDLDLLAVDEPKP